MKRPTAAVSTLVALTMAVSSLVSPVPDVWAAPPSGPTVDEPTGKRLGEALFGKTTGENTGHPCPDGRMESTGACSNTRVKVGVRGASVTIVVQAPALRGRPVTIETTRNGEPVTVTEGRVGMDGVLRRTVVAAWRCRYNISDGSQLRIISSGRTIAETTVRGNTASSRPGPAMPSRAETSRRCASR